MSVRLLVTMGDASGIGPEVLLRSVSRLRFPASLSVIGDLRWFKILNRRLRLSIPWSRYRWVDQGGVPPRFEPGDLRPVAGRAAHSYLMEAVRQLRAGHADALVTAPVSKEIGRAHV